MNILLIDDDKESMRYYFEALERGGFKVTQVRKPDSALQQLDAPDANFRLIILDSAMPAGKVYAEKPTDAGTLTGHFLFNDIRAKCPNTPIVILTNFFGLDW